MAPRKVCSACGHEKDAVAFTPERTQPDGLAATCNACCQGGRGGQQHQQGEPDLAAGEVAADGASGGAAPAARRPGRPARQPAPLPLTEKARALLCYLLHVTHLDLASLLGASWILSCCKVFWCPIRNLHQPLAPSCDSCSGSSQYSVP